MFEFRLRLAASWAVAAVLCRVLLPEWGCAQALRTPESGLFDPTRYEVRAGFFSGAQIPGVALDLQRERGTPNLNGELITPKFFTISWLPDFFTPRFRLGGMGNLGGGTSYAYAGALWTANFTDRIFGEYSFGGAFHDGTLSDYAGPTRNLLGCRALYELGAGLGYRFDEKWSALISFDHLSNGTPTFSNCVFNESINVWGLRVGYSFPGR